MKALKLKTLSTKAQELAIFEGQPKSGSMRVQAVFYSSTNPSQSVMLYDRDGDCFVFPIPGQLDKKVISLETPVTVSLPVYYLDQVGECELIVFGEQE